MPKRSRSGVVSRPVRVVAPTSVNGGRSIVSVRAAAPWPNDDVEPEVLERRIEDLLGGPVEPVDLVDEQHVARLDARSGSRRCPSSRAPARRRCGCPTPSSSRMICASVVLPSPGGPASSTWSSASSRAFAASRAMPSCSLIRSWPTKSSSRRGRSERSTSLVLGSRRPDAQELRAHAALRSATAARAPRAELGIDVRRARCSASSTRVAELDERVAGDEVRRASPRPRTRGVVGREPRPSPSARARSARPSSSRSPGSPGSARDPPSAIARRSSAAGEPETTASATFGPTPLTVSSWTNSSRSPASAKP